LEGFELEDGCVDFFWVDFDGAGMCDPIWVPYGVYYQRASVEG